MPSRRTTPAGYERARQLRKQPTPAETKLWSRLRLGQVQGVRFRRQHAIGRYVVDFCSANEKLIIEVDGRPHRDPSNTDAARTAFLDAQGYGVLRFWNSRVMDDIDGVVREISRVLGS